jgi:hypothetical protein
VAIAKSGPCPCSTVPLIRLHASRSCSQPLYPIPTPGHANPKMLNHTLFSPSPIPTISYSPAPSRPRPLPLPLDSPPPSSAAEPLACGFVAPPPLPPKLIGRSSRHWHAHTPKDVIRVALHICKAHQKRFVGIECEYKEVTIRCMKCTVSAKSRTSFDLAMSRRIKTAL